MLRSGIRVLASVIALAASASGCGSGPGGENDAGGVGAVAVEAGIAYEVSAPVTCPGIASFSVDSAELRPNQLAHVEILTAGPAPSFVRWSVSPAAAGVFSDDTAAATTFGCTSLGTATIAVKVGITVPGRGNVCEGGAYTAYETAVRCDP